MSPKRPFGCAYRPSGLHYPPWCCLGGLTSKAMRLRMSGPFEKGPKWSPSRMIFPLNEHCLFLLLRPNSKMFTFEWPTALVFSSIEEAFSSVRISIFSPGLFGFYSDYLDCCFTINNCQVPHNLSRQNIEPSHKKEMKTMRLHLGEFHLTFDWFESAFQGIELSFN